MFAGAWDPMRVSLEIICGSGRRVALPGFSFNLFNGRRAWHRLALIPNTRMLHLHLVNQCQNVGYWSNRTFRGVDLVVAEPLTRVNLLLLTFIEKN